jgi:hypothetical protein
MHFHLPKPLHGWREFAGEIAIIVIGVLIALGAEQAVETVHWRSEVESERGSLLQEARDNFEVVAARARQQGCVDRRLADVRELLQEHQRRLPLEVVAQVGQPARYSATRGTWQIALAGQALGHMPHNEKLKFSDAFGWFEVWDQTILQESAIWLRLAPLNTPSLLTDNNWSDLTSAYAEAVVVNERIRLFAPQILNKKVPGVWRYRPAGNFSARNALRDQICRTTIRGMTAHKD